MVESAQSQVSKLKEQFGGVYSDISISEGDNNTVVYNIPSMRLQRVKLMLKILSQR
jgi:hypothetical protein